MSGSIYLPNKLLPGCVSSIPRRDEWGISYHSTNHRPNVGSEKCYRQWPSARYGGDWCMTLQVEQDKLGVTLTKGPRKLARSQGGVTLGPKQSEPGPDFIGPGRSGGTSIGFQYSYVKRSVGSVWEQRDARCIKLWTCKFAEVLVQETCFGLVISHPFAARIWYFVI